MTYGRVRDPDREHVGHGAAVSHTAELVRGNFVRCERPPHPPVSPKASLRAGEKESQAPVGQ